MDKAAIFDLDGTQVDSVPDIGYAASLAFKYLGLRISSVGEYKTFPGGGYWWLLSKAISLSRNSVLQTAEEFERAAAVKNARKTAAQSRTN